MSDIDGKLLKWALNIFNLIVLLIGIALIIIGSLFLSVFKHDFEFAKFSVQLVSIAFIVIGSLMLLVSVFGFLAMRTTNGLLYIIHIVALIGLFIALAIIGIWGLTITSNGDLASKTKSEINETIYNYDDKNKDSLDTREINWLQSKFKCCGLNSYEDWEIKNLKYQEVQDDIIQRLRKNNQTIFDVPDSCCLNITDGCGKQFPEIVTLNQRGCYQPFFDFLAKDMKILCGIACGLAFLTLIAIAALLFVAFSVNGDYSELSAN